MGSTRNSRVRRRCFRLFAIALALLPFFLFEVVCRWAGWGVPDLSSDPFVGFRSIQPLFVQNAAGDRWHIPETRTNWFCRESFAVKKPADQFRVFALGGSTVQGRPFAIQTAFTAWLELNLKLADDSHDWRVINCGGVSYASYRLVPILQETLQHDPDLYIIYTGHNEFLEDRSYGHLRDSQLVTERIHSFSRHSRAFNTVRKWFEPEVGPAEPATLLPAEVEAWLDHEAGMDQYRRDLPWQRNVIQHFEFNLRRMIRLAEAAGVPVILVNPVSNLRDCPPFKAEHRDDLSPADLAQWESLVAEARGQFSSNMPAAITVLEAARKIDDQYAGLHFLLGRCYERVGRKKAALKSFIAAKDHDICPLRMLESMHQVVHRVARSTGTPLLDVRQLLADKTGGQIQGSYWMVDHVHPSVEGHQAIAADLFGLLTELELVSPRDGWQSEQSARFEAHVSSLDDAYFLLGMARLEGLKKWARQRFENQ